MNDYILVDGPRVGRVEEELNPDYQDYLNSLEIVLTRIRPANLG